MVPVGISERSQRWCDPPRLVSLHATRIGVGSDGREVVRALCGGPDLTVGSTTFELTMML